MIISKMFELTQEFFEKFSDEFYDALNTILNPL